MNLRLANISDLPKIKAMYVKIVNNMNRNNIQIWDEVYPCEFFSEDIENSRLYILYQGHNEIIAAFALCGSNAGESFMKWENNNGRAIYLDRFGVNIGYSRQGIGSLMLKKAIMLAKQKNYNYLRLFVVDINVPAINLYLKNGFKQVDGIYIERIDNDNILHEYGFEIKL